MTTPICIKRGDSLEIAFQAGFSLVGYTVRSHVRSEAGGLIEEFAVAVSDAGAGSGTLTSAETEGWPIGVAVYDMEFTGPDGKVTHTMTNGRIDVREAVTR